jgi:hypothetical protein
MLSGETRRTRSCFCETEGHASRRQGWAGGSARQVPAACDWPAVGDCPSWRRKVVSIGTGRRGHWAPCRGRLPRRPPRTRRIDYAHDDVGVDGRRLLRIMTAMRTRLRNLCGAGTGRRTGGCPDSASSFFVGVAPADQRGLPECHGPQNWAWSCSARRSWIFWAMEIAIAGARWTAAGPCCLGKPAASRLQHRSVAPYEACAPEMRCASFVAVFESYPSRAAQLALLQIPREAVLRTWRRCKAAWRMAHGSPDAGPRRSLASLCFSSGNPCAQGAHPSPQSSTVSVALNRRIPSSPLAPGEHHRTWYRDILPVVLLPLPFLPTLPCPRRLSVIPLSHTHAFFHSLLVQLAGPSILFACTVLIHCFWKTEENSPGGRISIPSLHSPRIAFDTNLSHFDHRIAHLKCGTTHGTTADSSCRPLRIAHYLSTKSKPTASP